MRRAVKLAALITAMAILGSCFAFSNAAVLAEQSDIFFYKTVGSSAVLTGISGSASGEIVVPDTLDGLKVTMVDGAFKNVTRITSVVLPDNITVITNDSFAYCTSLRSITLPANLSHIGEAAFCGCVNLQSVEIPNSVTAIDSYAFAWCEKLKSLTLSENLYRIPKGAFNGCRLLSVINIPEKVNFIEQDAFVDTAYYDNQSNWDNGLLYVGKHLVAAKKTIVGRCELREDTKSISDLVFGGCTLLSQLVIYKDVKIVGENVNSNCRNLTDIYYSGTTSDRRRMNVAKNNYNFKDKPLWHYEYDPNEKEYAPGDVNADDSVNNKDALRLFKYLSSWDIDFEESVLDVNGDKNVNNKDLTRLMQYLSGWDVKIYSKHICAYEDGDDHGPVVEF